MCKTVCFTSMKRVLTNREKEKEKERNALCHSTPDNGIHFSKEMPVRSAKVIYQKQGILKERKVHLYRFWLRSQTTFRLIEDTLFFRSPSQLPVHLSIFVRSLTRFQFLAHSLAFTLFSYVFFLWHE